jgi:hypothetical protein
MGKEEMTKQYKDWIETTPYYIKSDSIKPNINEKIIQKQEQSIYLNEIKEDDPAELIVICFFCFIFVVLYKVLGGF